MIGRERDFIEAAVAAVREAKELVLPLLMVQAPDAPWTAAGLREFGRGAPLIGEKGRQAAELLVDLEVPFLVEEERLEAEGCTLVTDPAGFEVAMVAFERRFWHERYLEHRADPTRRPLTVPPRYDVCERHRLGRADVRRVIRDNGVSSFAELAPLLGSDPDCRTCHLEVTRMLTAELRRRKAPAP